MDATLFLANGKSVEGKLIISTENTLGSPVKIYLQGDSKPQKYNLSEVKGYQIRNDFYELKQIKGNWSIGKNMSFMKRLTPKDSRIHLYENTERVSVSNTNRDGSTTNTNRYETQYYMQFPNEEGDGVWAVNSSKLVPNFDEKMSKLVADCPTLATKIAAKEPGYFYAQISLFNEKRAAVLWSIIKEYNDCKYWIRL